MIGKYRELKRTGYQTIPILDNNKDQIVEQPEFRKIFLMKTTELSLIERHIALILLALLTSLFFPGIYAAFAFFGE